MIHKYSTKTFDTTALTNALSRDLLDTEKLQTVLTSPRGFNSFPLEIHTTTDDFFYGERKLLDRYKGTEFEKLWNSLERPGEAQIQVLDRGRCYLGHCDVDDRYHMTLFGNNSYLIDIEKNNLFPTEVDHTVWFLETSTKHTAANFGTVPRVQLVIRKLLNKNSLKNPVPVYLHLQSKDKHFKNATRYNFDVMVQSFINTGINKNKTIDQFKGDLATASSDVAVYFEIEQDCLIDVEQLAKNVGCILKIDNSITEHDRSLLGTTSMNTILKK